MRGSEKAVLDSFHRNVEYFDVNHSQLVQDYTDQWVAIFGERVVGADRDLDTLVEKLDSQNLPVGEVLVERVSATQEIWLFPSG